MFPILDPFVTIVTYSYFTVVMSAEGSPFEGTSLQLVTKPVASSTLPWVSRLVSPCGIGGLGVGVTCESAPLPAFVCFFAFGTINARFFFWEGRLKVLIASTWTHKRSRSQADSGIIMFTYNVCRYFLNTSLAEVNRWFQTRERRKCQRQCQCSRCEKKYAQNLMNSAKLARWSALITENT
jgi:hypothetical protein